MLKALLRPGMQVRLQNGLIRPILVSKQGLYINLSATTNKPVIIIDRDYDENLVCVFYKYNIDAIYDLPDLIEPEEYIEIYVQDGSWIWKRNKGFSNEYMIESIQVQTNDIIKQVDLIRENVVESALHNIVFDYAKVLFKLNDTLSELFKTSSKAGNVNG